LSRDVFIAHSSEDRLQAEALCSALEAHGIGCWIAPRDVIGGQDYAEALVDAVGSCRALVLVFSRHANDSAHVHRELELAVTRRVPIVPIRIEQAPMAKAVQYFVGSHHWLDAFDGPIERHLDRLVSSIRALLRGREAESERAGAPAPGPSFALMARQPECLVGRHLGPYVLRSVLGVGGSGAAYAAWDTQLGRKMCVKVLHPGSALDRIRAAVERAVRALAALQHPGVVRVHGTGDVTLADGASLYVAMELIDGLPLDAWSRSLSDDASRRRLAVAQAIAEALAAAHACHYVDDLGFEQTGLLHGDLKPANVLVRSDDSPVVVDFLMMDVRRLQDPRVLAKREVPLTAAFGTPGFMAPEQESDGLVTVRTDVYGLGVTLCHLFYVEAPSPVMAALTSRPDDPAPGLGRLLRRMMERSPDSRPASMAEVVAELDAVRRGAASVTRGSPARFRGASLWTGLLSWVNRTGRRGS
jgi:TIR domain/Protein kinase domain